jgi:hypothetical protein
MAINSFKFAGLYSPSPSPYADFSDTATGTYTDGAGIAWKYIQFNSSGSLVVTRAGFADLLVISGGGTAFTNNITDSGENAGGGAGGLLNRPYVLEAITYTVTVGGAGGNSSFGSLATTTAGANASINNGGNQGTNNQPGNGFVGWKVYGQSTGAGAGGNGVGATPGGGPGVASSITGASVTYGRGGSRNQGSGFTPATPNSGNGGTSAPTGYGSNDPGASGVVIVRVRTN